MSQSNPMADIKSLPPFDLGMLGGGILTFIVSFFPWYGVNVLGVSVSENAWHSYSVLALLLSLVGLAIAAAETFAKSSMPTLPVGARWIAAGVFSLAFLLELLRIVTLHHGDGLGVRWGGWLLLIVMLATAASAVISALSSDEVVPWQQARGGAVPPAPPVGPSA